MHALDNISRHSEEAFGQSPNLDNDECADVIKELFHVTGFPERSIGKKVNFNTKTCSLFF